MLCEVEDYLKNGGGLVAASGILGDNTYDPGGFEGPALSLDPHVWPKLNPDGKMTPLVSAEPSPPYEGAQLRKASQLYIDFMLDLYGTIEMHELPEPGSLRKRREYIDQLHQYVALRELVRRDRACALGQKRTCQPSSYICFTFQSSPWEVFTAIARFL